MKNKWSILVTACLLLGLLAGCSDETGSTIPEEASSATTEAAVQETAQPNPEQADSTGEEAVQSASAAEETAQPDLTISMPLTEDEVSFTLWHDFVPLLSDYMEGMQDNLSFLISGMLECFLHEFVGCRLSKDQKTHTRIIQHLQQNSITRLGTGTVPQHLHCIPAKDKSYSSGVIDLSNFAGQIRQKFGWRGKKIIMSDAVADSDFANKRI